jgi:hypothetical protein
VASSAVDKALMRASRTADERSVPAAEARIVVFSDLHKGVRDGADVITPCYFNTGCCCLGDGDFTGLEIADGEIRLLRWPLDDGTPRRKVLAHRALDDVLDAVAARPREAVTGQETPA